MGWVRCGLVTDNSILNLPTTNTASGSIAQFNTDLTENLLSAVAEFSATQASGTPTPAAPIPIVGVDKVNVTRCGINRWDEEWERGGLRSTDGTTTTDTNRVRSKNLIPIKSGLAYYFKMPANATLYFYKNDGSYINYTAIGSNVVYTIPNGVSYIKFVMGSSTTPVTSITTGEVSINYPSTDTEYHAYNGITVIINLGGTYYGGEVDAVTGKITLTHIYIFSDGTDDTNWSYYSAYGSSTNFRYAYSGLKVSGNIICNLLPKGNVGNDREIVAISGNGNYINFEISSSRLNGNTVADLMTFFASNNVQLVVELATPIVVYASNTAEIPTIIGDNQVYADTGDVALKYFETVGHKI